MNVSENDKNKIISIFQNIDNGSTNPTQIYKLLNKKITLKKN